MSSRHERKRKREEDTSGERDRNTERNSRKRRSSSPPAKEESLSIEETNKLRAKLGLTPLDVNEDAPKNDDKSQIPLREGEELFTEDGVNIVHKAPKNWSQEKSSAKLKEKIETQKQKRIVESKVLKVRKGLAESDSEDESASSWVKRNRKMEEERKKAEKKAKMLDELDEAFSISGFIEQERKHLNKTSRSTTNKSGNGSITGGLTVGHSKEVFVDGKETVLVLQDKSVLDEDDDEVLVNPNLLENERHKKNVELKKANKTGYKAYEDDEQFDAYGQITRKDILDKYNEVLDGDEMKREKFRLDNEGGYDLEKETYEAEVKRKLMMANKKFESLECARPALAREFYTEEEMISFRRPKKKKDSNKIRKRKTLKASDLMPETLNEDDGLTEEERNLRAAKLAARRGGKVEKNAIEEEVVPKGLEEGELEDESSESRIQVKEKWKKSTAALVDVNKLKKFVEEIDKKEEDDSDSEDLIGGVDLTGVVLEDNAEDELNLALKKTRLLKQTKIKKEFGAEQIRSTILSSMSAIKEECIEEDEIDSNKRKIVFDATSERYKSIGEIPTLGLAGNRQGGVDYSTLDDEYVNNNVEEMELSKEAIRKHYSDIDSNDEEAIREAKEKLRKKKKRSSDKRERGAWDEDMENPSSSQHKESDSENSDEDLDDYENVLGEEKDVSKGVAAMLKLAGVKGYLENSSGRRAGEGTLKHLESKRFSKIEQGRYDIEDKTMRKLERMGTTGTGPIRAFPEKGEYKPDVEVTYSDKKGRLMSSKEAFRVLSWKFHGKGPGKKQIEKHQAQLEKKERLKKMNSMDTPLGTLAKQRKKQEQLQTPYLFLSGGRDNGAPLQKD